MASGDLRQVLSAFLENGVSAELLDVLCEGFTRLTLDKGQGLLREGELWRQVFFVERGLLRLYYSTPDGREFNKGFFREGDLMWPIAPSARQEPSLFSMAALESCELRVADFASLQQRLRGEGLWERFALPFAEWLADQKFLREYEFLVYPAGERYRRFCLESPELVDRIPDYHLASYLGMSHVTLSRIKHSGDLNLG